MSEGLNASSVAEIVAIVAGRAPLTVAQANYFDRCVSQLLFIHSVAGSLSLSLEGSQPSITVSDSGKPISLISGSEVLMMGSGELAGRNHYPLF
jgi:hypothetical protein